MKNKAAVQLGKRGGEARTDAKAEAARANGAKGGAPFKVALTKADLITLVELVATDVARLMKNRQQDPSHEKFWTEKITEQRALAHKLDVLLGEPSIFEHYLREKTSF